MPSLTSEERLAKLNEKQRKNLAKIRSLAGSMGAQSRADNKRCVYLIGEMMLGLAGQNPSVLKAIKTLTQDLDERDRKVFERWNLDEKAPVAAANAKARKAAREEAEKAADPKPSPSISAPGTGAFGGAPVSPPSSTAPAPTGAASAQPIKVITT